MKPEQRVFRRSLTTGYVGSSSNWSSAPRRYDQGWRAHQPEHERVTTGLMVGAVVGAAAWAGVLFLMLSIGGN
jgi:hypothetical protein